MPGFRSWLAVENKNFPLIRAAQQAVCDKDGNAYLCSISDIGEELDIHPKNKKDVGERLCLLALKYLYGKDILADAPRFVSAKREGDRVRLIFDHAGTGLVMTGDTLEALTVTESGKTLEYRPEIEGNALLLKLEKPADGTVHIAFAKGAWYRVNLFNEAGIPAVPFETECR